LTTESTPSAAPPHDPENRADRSFFGHPRALATLFGLEVWERFSYLGMQAILVLYFTATVADGGLAMEGGNAASIAAGYGTMVYLVSVGGGWIADRILGSHRAVLAGGGDVFLLKKRQARVPVVVWWVGPTAADGVEGRTKYVGGGVKVGTYECIAVTNRAAGWARNGRREARRNKDSEE
jgi:hypothetical protein